MLVWVRKNNGTWWPGRVMEEIKKKINKKNVEKSAVELLNKPTSLEWFDLENSKRIKAFRCEEFSDCIKKAESKLSQYPKGTLKYARREDAIRLALQLEKEMRNKIKKRKAGDRGGHNVNHDNVSSTGEEQAMTVYQTKRSRSVYLPAETNGFPNSPPGSNLSKSGTSVKTTPSHGTNTAQETKLSAVDTLMATVPSQLRKNRQQAKNTKAELNPRSSGFLVSPLCQIVAAKHSAHEENIERKQKKLSNAQYRQEPVLNMESIPKTRNGTHYNDKSRRSNELVIKSVGHRFAAKELTQEVKNVSNDLVPVINGKSFSTIRNGTHHSGDTWDLRIMNPKTMEKSLDTMDARVIDVEVKVEESSGAKHVPLVSLMSRYNGKAIIGYPVNIERLSEYRLHKHESRPLTFLNNKGIAKKRRTPVSYASQPQSSPMPNNIKKAKNHQSDGPIVLACVPLAKIFSGLFLALGRL